MRFELFKGARSVAIIAWERPGQVRIEARAPDDLPALAEHFGGDPMAADGRASVIVPRADWGPDEFEEASLALRGQGLVVVARPAPPTSPPRPGRRSGR